MAVLKIPDAGLLLESSEDTMAGLPAQAFALNLDDSVIEDMIACVQDGQGITLSLGSSPVRLTLIPTPNVGVVLLVLGTIATTIAGCQNSNGCLASSTRRVQLSQNMHIGEQYLSSLG